MLRAIPCYLVLFVGELFGVDLSGTWSLAVEPPRATAANVEAVFAQHQGVLTGLYKGRLGSLAIKGSTKDNSLQFVIATERGDIHFVGKVDSSGKKVEGTITVKGVGSGKFKGQKVRDSTQDAKR